MLDPQLLRHHLDEIREKLAHRGFVVDHAQLADLETARKQCQVETQELQSERNHHSKAIGKAKAAGEDVTELLESVSELGDKLRAREAQLEAIQAHLNDLLMGLPNLPHESVPIGSNETDNVEVRRWFDPTAFEFTPKDHVDLGVNLGLLDFETAAKITGSRFSLMRDALARHRALIIVGGVVLFLQILLIYSVLKLVLGFSVPEKFLAVNNPVKVQSSATHSEELQTPSQKSLQQENFEIDNALNFEKL